MVINLVTCTVRRRPGMQLVQCSFISYTTHTSQRAARNAPDEELGFPALPVWKTHFLHQAQQTCCNIFKTCYSLHVELIGFLFRLEGKVIHEPFQVVHVFLLLQVPLCLPLGDFHQSIHTTLNRILICLSSDAPSLQDLAMASATASAEPHAKRTPPCCLNALAVLEQSSQLMSEN